LVFAAGSARGTVGQQRAGGAGPRSAAGRCV